MTPGKLPGIPVAFYNRLHFATAAQQQKESRSHCWRSVGGRWAVKFSRQYRPHYIKNGGLFNDYVSFSVPCPVFRVVPDRHCGLLVQRQPVREVGRLKPVEQAPYLRKDVSAVLIDDVAFELECGIALVSAISDGMDGDRFSREVYAQALYAAVEYLQRSHQHLKDQIYTSTPAGSPERTLPQNDPKGVPV